MDISEDSLRYAHDILLPLNVETCGFLEYNDAIKQYIIVVDTFGKSGECTHNSYQRVIFHTHPHSAKFYPSTADIFKVLKHSRIQTSVIFSSLGIWEITFTGKMPITKKEIDYVEKLNIQLYKSTERGRKYSKEAIDYYISKLMKIPKLYVQFKLW